MGALKKRIRIRKTVYSATRSNEFHSSEGSHLSSAPVCRVQAGWKRRPQSSWAPGPDPSGTPSTALSPRKMEPIRFKDYKKNSILALQVYCRYILRILLRFLFNFSLYPFFIPLPPKFACLIFPQRLFPTPPHPKKNHHSILIIYTPAQI